MSPFVTPPAIGPLLERDRTLSLYIHVPFCASRCIYCDFYSTVSSNFDTESGRYVNALLAQIRTVAEHFSGAVTSVYFGGGTPSLLGEEIAVILNQIKELFSLSPDVEITIEANPESVSAAILDTWGAAGATRISLGVQSFNNETLKMLGRIHSSEKVEEALELLRMGKWSFSVDLIAGIPGVAHQEWKESLHKAITSGACHVSVYPLAVEEGTPLERLIAQNVIDEVDEDISADHMLIARHDLIRAGISHYEISNFAKPGCESRHNTRYWTGGSYLGLGPGAASMLYVNGNERVRFALHESLEDFFANPSVLEPAEWEDLNAHDSEREDIMLGLRLFKGVEASKITHAGLNDTMKRALNQELVEFVEGFYRLTERGWLLGNEVFSAVWCDE